MSMAMISKEDVRLPVLLKRWPSSMLNYSSLVDYNSWVESDKARKLASTLDKDTIIVEGYREFDTGRRHMAREGDWRKNKDEELELDGIGGVNIVVKADVHRAGSFSTHSI